MAELGTFIPHDGLNPHRDVLAVGDRSLLPQRREVTDMQQRVGDGVRTDHMGRVFDDLTPTLDRLASTGLYNNGGESHTIANLAHIQKLVRENFHSPDQPGDAIVMLPFHDEPETIGDNIAYATSRVGNKNVLPIGTGKHTESMNIGQNIARKHNVEVADQSQIAQAIDWKKLREIVGIEDDSESNTMLFGSKGLTVLMGLIKLEALREQGQTTNNPIVVLHDTDVTNPIEYGGIEMTLAPFAHNPNLLISLMAKNGIGRNNEPIFTAYSMLLSSDDPLVRQMAVPLSRLVWPLTGERAIRLDTLLNMPFASGMGLETAVNMYVAGIEAAHEGDTTRVAQVLNPAPKLENRPSESDREFKMIISLGVYTKAFEKVITKSGKFMHEWGLEEIRDFNTILRNMHMIAVVPAKVLGPNKLEQIQPDYLLPPVQTMIELGIIDMDKVKQSLAETAVA